MLVYFECFNTVQKAHARALHATVLHYKEYFNAGVSIFISHITIFTFATKLFIENWLIP